MAKFPGILAALLLLMTAPFSAGLGSEVSEALPPDTLVYVEVPNVAALHSLDDDTAYGRIMAEEQVKTFLSEGLGALSTSRDAFSSAAGRELGDVIGLCEGTMAFAVMADMSAPGAVVLVVEVGPDSSEASSFVEELSATISPTWEEEEIPGATMKWTQAGLISPAYVFAGDYLVVSLSRPLAADVASALMSGRAESLADNETYVKALAASSAGQPELLIYANLAEAAERFLPFAPPAAAQAYSKLGLDSLGSAVYTSTVVGRGFVDKVLLQFPEGRKGVFASLEGSGEDYAKHMALIPADVLGASWSRVDFGGLYGTVKDTVSSVLGPIATAPIAGNAAIIENELGISLEEDLIGAIGKNFVVYTPKPSMMMGMALSGGFGQQVMMIEIEDEERFESALAKVWAHLEERMKTMQAQQPDTPAPPASFSTEPFGDDTIYTVRVTMPQMPIQLTPAVAVKDGWLYVSGHSQGIKNILGAPAATAPGILTNSAYMDAAAICGPANAGASYTDTATLFETLYSVAGIALPMALAQFGGEAPIDQTLLPESGVIKQHLFASASATNVSEYSVEHTSYSPVGNVRALHAFATAFGSLGVWAREIQGASMGRPAAPVTREPEPDPDLVKSELATIGRGLFVYARAHGNDFPPDLATLDAEGLLDDSDVSIDVSDYIYVPGLSIKSDPRMIVAFSRTSGPSGRGVLLTNMNVMNLTDAEVSQQAGGWVDLSNVPGESERRNACAANVKALAESVRSYARSNDNRFPDELDSNEDYRFAPLATTCPSGQDTGEPHYRVPDGIRMPGVPLSDVDKGDFILVYEAAFRHDGKAAVALMDGTVKFLSKEELEKLLKRMSVFHSR